MNIRLTIEYDGTSYHGWQIQKNGVTVQETIQSALKKITGEDISVVGCGRTDSGVHALNYVCSFRTESSVPPERFTQALNSKLPSDIRCKSSSEAAEDFHAANSAVAKTYIYRILNSGEAGAFERNYAWHFKYPLDIEKMRTAAEALLLRRGKPRPEPSCAEEARRLADRLTDRQLTGLESVLRQYAGECDYNVGVGHVLGGLAAKWEELL